MKSGSATQTSETIVGYFVVELIYALDIHGAKASGKMWLLCEAQDCKVVWICMHLPRNV